MSTLSEIQYHLQSGQGSHGEISTCTAPRLPDHERTQLRTEPNSRVALQGYVFLKMIEENDLTT